MLTIDALPARIRSKILIPENPDECWTWLAATSPAGYGRVGWNGKTREAHRVVYSILVREIPEGMVLDHICHDPFICRKANRECHHRRCQNPAHLAVVTRGANALRSFSPPALNAYSDRCSSGHIYEPGTYNESEGHRRCLICRRERDHERRPRGMPRKGIPRKGVREYRPQGETPERQARDAEIVRLRESGLTFSEVAAQAGVSESLAFAGYAKATASLRTQWPPQEVKALRKRLGLSQPKFGELLGVTFSAVSVWERGTNAPSPKIMARLDELLAAA